LVLSYYLQSLEIRHFIWGERGPVTHDIFLKDLVSMGGFSLLTYSSSPLYLEVLFIAGLISAISVIIGLFTTTSLLLSLILLWSFHMRNEYILDGGDNIGRIILFFLLFMDCSTYFSLDSQLTRQKRVKPILNILHNSSLYAITFQFCFLYLSSSLAKISGPVWQNGTAIYYVLKSNAYSNPAWGSVLSSSYFFITVASYSVIALQGAFISLIWTKHWRVPIILALMLMHICIGYQLGLARFSIAMIAVLLLLIPDGFYLGIRQGAGRIVGAKRAKAWLVHHF
jgi:hypothetical protein